MALSACKATRTSLFLKKLKISIILFYRKGGLGPRAGLNWGRQLLREGCNPGGLLTPLPRLSLADLMEGILPMGDGAQGRQLKRQRESGHQHPLSF